MYKQRKIIHIDMDAFFASIEQRDNPQYKGKPLAVGFAGVRGVVAAASYEAREYGVRSAMPSTIALRKCPHLIFVPSRFEAYRAVSQQIMSIFHEYTDLIEPLSLDEAFLDVTVNHKNIHSATLIATEIRKKIFEVTSLTASAGVSYNKFLAKIASDYNKPDGMFLIKPKDGEAFVEQLPIERFFGIGRVTAEKMHLMSIRTGGDLKNKTEQELTAIFGKAGSIYYQNARGIDLRPVESNRTRKSIGAETTFPGDVSSLSELRKTLLELSEEVIERMNRRLFQGYTVILKVKYADFRNITRSKSVQHPIVDADTLFQIGSSLLNLVELLPIRLIGIYVKTHDTPLVKQSEAIQLELKFREEEDSN